MASLNDAMFTKNEIKGKNYKQSDKPKIQQGFRKANSKTREESVANNGPKCLNVTTMVILQDIVMVTPVEAAKIFQKTAENEEAFDPQHYQQAIGS